jgi:hypothetical protein
MRDAGCIENIFSFFRMLRGNQSAENRRRMQSLFHGVDDSRAPLVRAGVDDFAERIGMTNENRRKLQSMVHIVPAAEFKLAIRDCVDWFRRTFAKFEARFGRPPVFAIGRHDGTKRKSSDWLEHLLVEALGAPSFYVYVDGKMTKPKEKGSLDFIVMLDDAVYTGMQMSAFAEGLQDERDKIARMWSLERPPVILLATAYATDHGAADVRETLRLGSGIRKRDNSLDFDRYFSARFIETPEWKNEYSLSFSQEMKNLLFKYGNLGIHNKTTFTVMPHKTPNFHSFGFWSRRGANDGLSNMVTRRTGHAAYKGPLQRSFLQRAEKT